MNGEKYGLVQENQLRPSPPPSTSVIGPGPRLGQLSRDRSTKPELALCRVLLDPGGVGQGRNGTRSRRSRCRVHGRRLSVGRAVCSRRKRPAFLMRCKAAQQTVVSKRPVALSQFLFCFPPPAAAAPSTQKAPRPSMPIRRASEQRQKLPQRCTWVVRMPAFTLNGRGDGIQSAGMVSRGRGDGIQPEETVSS